MHARQASLAFAAVTLFTAGCYTNSTIAVSDVRRIPKPAQGPIQMATSSWDGARLGPRTAVRARRRDGSVSAWFRAGSLSKNAQGLLTGRSLALSQMAVAVVRGLGSDGSSLASFLAPPGAQVSLVNDGIVLHGAPGTDVARWAAAVTAGSLSAGGPAGTWTFYEPKSGWIAEEVEGEDLAAIPMPEVGRLRIMEGIPWTDVAGLEVNNFDPLTSVAAAAGAALLVAMFVASAKSGGDPTPVFDFGVRAGIAAAESRDEDSGPAPVGDDTRREGFVVDPAATDTTLAAAPLFTGSARRRDIAKLLLSVDSSWAEGNTISTGAGVGARFFDFWELSARIRGLHTAAEAVDGAAKPVDVLLGGRLGVNIDGDGQPLSAWTLGLEIDSGRFAGVRPMTVTTLSIGPRIGIGRKSFVSLLFSPTYVSIDDGPYLNAPLPFNGSEWRLMFGGELGLAL